jgi:hypothetical protein
MLVPFAIDSDSLAADPSWTPATLRACHRQLLDLCDRVGLLVHDGDRFDQSKLRQAIDHLPQNQRTLWMEMLERSPPVPCSTNWNGAVASSSVRDLCSDASLALIEDVRAEAEFGLHEDEDEVTIEPEPGHRLILCRLQAARHASVVENALRLSQQNIEPGTGYQAIWDSRFRALAVAPSPSLKKVFIVGRYAMEQHFRCPQQYLSGLHRFLRLLDKDAGGPRYVHSFSAWTQELSDKAAEDVQAEMSEVIARLQRGTVRQLFVHMVPNSKFGKTERDRYVRFGPYVWELGHGLDILEGPQSAHLCQASFKRCDGTHRRVESDLEHQTQPSAIKIRR